MKVRMFLPYLFFVTFCFIVSGCGDDDEVSTQPLPSGCSNSNGVYATQVVSTNFGCIPTNQFTNAEEMLGGPNASATGPGKTEFRGFTSLGVNGSVTVFMGSCVQDLPGNDVRVYQSVSEEAVEVQASATEGGPYVSLGAKNCVDPPPFFVGFCEFDLAGTGLSQARFLKIIDREIMTFPGAQCDNTGMSPGADIDAVQNLHPAS